MIAPALVRWPKTSCGRLTRSALRSHNVSIRLAFGVSTPSTSRHGFVKIDNGEIFLIVSRITTTKKQKRTISSRTLLRKYAAHCWSEEWLVNKLCCDWKYASSRANILPQIFIRLRWLSFDFGGDCWHS